MTDHTASDSGFTLVEMLVALALTTLVMTVIGGLFISLTQTQQTVDAVTSSTTSGQQVATTITDRVRNGSGFRVTSVGSDQLLVTRSAGTGSTLTWTCYGWYYSAADESLRMTTSTPGTRITAPTSAQLTSWTLLASGVTPRGTAPVFAPDDTGSVLTVTFDTHRAGHPSVAIQTSASPLTGTTEDNSCF
ncbi:hypothetical protein GCM10009840_12080 [Pseudolysinimonas kribbensis]|uniref:PulJ/GspJ family protein n=1 Tax=Pseudolysinimonas kribbensis TaxID=433641 RepID=UPI0031E2EBEC